jgi:hydrogenase nickel incorporation protein HypA/HybF
MHELSLCQAIVDTVNAHASDHDVRRVTVRVGYLRQAVPDSLTFSWQMLTQGTALDGCELAIEHVPAVVACRVCGTATELDVPLVMCPECGSDDVELVSGEEFLIASIDVAVDDEDASGEEAVEQERAV